MSRREQGKHPRVARGRGKAWVRFVLAWALLFGLWLLVVGSLAPSELVAGVIVAAMAAAVVDVIRREHVSGFRPDPRWLLRLRTVPGRTLREFGLLVAALARVVLLRRRVVGRFVAVDVEVGGNDGRSIARRALVVAGASIAPNSYVVDFDHEGDRVIVHQLLPPYHTHIDEVVP